MPCYHPLKAWQIGVHSSGKPKYKITSYNVQYLGLLHGHWKEYYAPGFSAEHYQREFIEIPCGKCIGCRLDYSRTWADRIIMESTLHEQNSFVTLTYDDDHLPFAASSDPTTGEYRALPTLVRRDITLFLKRLRKALSGSQESFIRYYVAGEYGPRTFRPHYHAAIFGFWPDDAVWYADRDGFSYYHSEFLSSIWKNGEVCIGELSHESAAYVARYVTGKVVGADVFGYDLLNLQPPFATMSRRPGIGAGYYELHGHKEHYELPDGLICPSPRYFDQKYDLTNSEDLAIIKERRRLLASLVQRSSMNSGKNSSSDYCSSLLADEIRVQDRLKRLPRSSI